MGVCCVELFFLSHSPERVPNGEGLCYYKFHRRDFTRQPKPQNSLIIWSAYDAIPPVRWFAKRTETWEEEGGICLGELMRDLTRGFLFCGWILPPWGTFGRLWWKGRISLLSVSGESKGAGMNMRCRILLPNERLPPTKTANCFPLLCGLQVEKVIYFYLKSKHLITKLVYSTN